VNPTTTRRFRGTADLRLVGRQIYYDQLSFWLNPIGAVFTIGFSVVFLLLLGANKSHVGFLGNIRVIQYYLGAFLAYGVMATCFNTLTVATVIRRENGLLKRIRLSPLPTWVLLAGVAGSSFLICVAQAVLLILIGIIVYGATFPSNVLALIVALVVGIVCFTAMGLATSTLIPNEDAAGPIVSIVFFVLLFLSGLWYPMKPGSSLARISDFFPIRHMIIATFAPFDTQPGVSGWSWHDIEVMAIWGVVAVFVALRRWQWAPRRFR
jgi:ABC-2 type transport system permease protein